MNDCRTAPRYAVIRPLEGGVVRIADEKKMDGIYFSRRYGRRGRKVLLTPVPNANWCAFISRLREIKLEKRYEALPLTEIQLAHLDRLENYEPTRAQRAKLATSI